MAMKTKLTEEEVRLGMAADITRRDFVNAALVGAGAALLGAAGCSEAGNAPRSPTPAGPKKYGSLGSEWTGPGGVGDYQESNGDTAEVVNAAHAVRDGFVEEILEGVIDTGEVYDLVVVGGGFAGLSAAYTLFREHGAQKSCLVLDNHPIFGGEAKQNEFAVDGHRLLAPQGSNGFVWPPGPAEQAGLFHRYWDEIGLPRELSWKDRADGTDKNMRFPKDHFTAMGAEEGNATTGFFYGDNGGDDAQWVIDPHGDGFAQAPIPPRLRQDLQALYSNEPLENLPEDWRTWLDSMTLREFLLDKMGLDAGVLNYVNGTIATSGGGLSASVVSAYSVVQYYAPPANRIWAAVAGQQDASDPEGFTLVSFPGGNTGIARAFVKKMLPNALQGGSGLHDILWAPLNWGELDKPGASVRLRMRSMVVSVEHEGRPESADYVNVAYTDTATGQAHRVKARAVMMGTGGWINKHVVRDLPAHLQAAFAEFFYGPILTVNVAVRHWRFMEKLGISAAQWFDGFGWFVNLRAQLDLGERTAPLHPDKPAVLTFYVPFLKPELDLAAQSVVARTELLATPYRDFERRVRRQLVKLFGGAGFNAEKDIAGIITNRWGHAYIVPQPGYYFGKDGNPAPREIVRQGFGRVAFGHSELSGEQLWSTAVAEGERAARQLMTML